MEATKLRGRRRNRWQDEVREDGRLVGGKGWKERVYNKRGMEEAPENGKESLHSAHADGMNEYLKLYFRSTVNTLHLHFKDKLAKSVCGNKPCLL